jgi:hypothetical protein
MRPLLSVAAAAARVAVLDSDSPSCENGGVRRLRRDVRVPAGEAFCR